jgi:hypothetical protein
MNDVVKCRLERALRDADEAGDGYHAVVNPDDLRRLLFEVGKQTGSLAPHPFVAVVPFR